MSILFSADLGNGYIKVKSTSSDGISYPAAISLVSDMLGDFSLGISNRNHDFVIGFEGQQYAIGETVRLKGLTPITILIIASELLRQLAPPGLAVVDHYAAKGMTNLWGVVDGKLKGISRKE